MPKKPCVRILVDSQHVQGWKTLLKSGGQYFGHIFWSVRNKISSKYSVLVLSGILRLFVNILKPDEKYALSVKASVQRNQFKCNYLEIEKFSLNFFPHLRNLHEILKTFEKKMSLRGYMFLKLYTAKSGVT